MTEEIFRLTQYSRGAGCGCKIAPKVLDEILRSGLPAYADKNLLVGNESKDDAAVYDIGNGMAIISTTDFFMPVVDDAFDFGAIAAANAISDVYAMGGKPLVAIAILGWPVEKLPAALAQQCLEGGRSVCNEANIPLAGGHSIDSEEPIFGLAVTGIIPIENIKRNNAVKEGDLLFLTKPLGTGVLTTAQKRGLLKEEHSATMLEQMKSLNRIGESLGKIKGVHAMTDITGFGFLGHLLEMIGKSSVTANINYHSLPVANGVKEYIGQRIFPDATTRNWNACSEKIKFEKGVNVMEAFTLLPDPQTNGGLLISVDKENAEEVKELFAASGLRDFITPVGELVAVKEKAIHIFP